MATIRKRGASGEVQIRRQGFPNLTKSFAARADAAAWARDKERAIDRGELSPTVRDLKGQTVGDLLLRYLNTVTPSKRGAAVERYRLQLLLRHPLAATPLAQLSAAAVSRYRDDRLKAVQSGTVRRELAMLQHCFELARREWGIALPFNPIRQIQLPNPSKPRQRRLDSSDTEQLFAAMKAGSPWYLKPVITLALETGMRRGELLSIRWNDIDLVSCTLKVLRTKNGHPRTVPLSPLAVAILGGLPRSDARIFPVTGNAVRLAWERLKRRAGVVDLRFHDLRHEAVSRLFELGLSVPEVAMVSGHRDARMLFRYTHPRAEDVARKLAAQT